MLARAKINLYLHVVGKRPDGYHLLDSLIVFAECGDEIAVAPADDLSLQIDGPFAAGLSAAGDNLVLRAAQGLRELCGIKRGAAIRLTKNLPLASGIGGGSADAAATLLALIDLWGAAPAHAELYALALRLGADVPVCLDGRPSLVGGIGEDIAAAGSLPPAHLLLVNPRVPTPTPQVFKARRGGFSAPTRWRQGPATVAELGAALAACSNDLTQAAIEVAPVVRDVLTEIAATPDCLLARLSGSGATCFGLYPSARAAEAARQMVLEKRPGWWAVAAPITA